MMHKISLSLPSLHTVTGSYGAAFNATFYDLKFLNTTPVGTTLYSFTIYVNPTTVPIGSGIIISITGNIGPSTFASDYFAFLSAHTYVYLHPITSASDYIIIDQIYYKTQTTLTAFTFNLQALILPYQLVGDNNVGVTVIGE